MNKCPLILLTGFFLAAASCNMVTPDAPATKALPVPVAVKPPAPSAHAPVVRKAPGRVAVPVAVSKFFQQGSSFGERDALGGSEKDPYRYRSQIDSKNWSDFVDGYLHGYALAIRH